ncbi:MAG TPA: hypothetical protein VGQ32_07910 [Thermoanaerobaculia bacterium]|jgi:hypothetical protein|nr:hypothetical protein [Thermoanaerobaculia bacterium]
MRTEKRIAGIVPFLFLGLAGIAAAQTWTPLANQPPFQAGNPLLLTDGTVIAHATCSPDWWRLTPDSSGSYVNGAWSQIASMPANHGPLYFASAVLPDGRVIVEGGEYNFCSPVWTTLGAIYDPVANSWKPVNPPAGWETIGDAQSAVLADGTFMLANCCTTETALFDAKKLTWKPTGAGKATVNDEEGWTLLPDGSLLTVDAYVFSYDASGTNSEIYNPATGAWSSAGSTIVQLWDSYPSASKASYELGPAVLRPDGTVFATGATGHGPGHTSIFDTKTRTWTPGPDFPNSLDIADGPAALLPNGNVLMETSPGVFKKGAVFFEWNGSALIEVPGPPPAKLEPSYIGNMLVLPTGEILWMDLSGNAWLYASTGAPSPAWAPVIQGGTATTVSRGKTYRISGRNFNGFSQGAAYGDDAQAATNYPLVRITNRSTGHVFYARTHDHSTMAVAYSGTASTSYDVPAGAETGLSDLAVVANGIPSAPITVTVQ